MNTLYYRGHSQTEAPSSGLSETVPLKQLKIKDTIFLPTVTSAQEIVFTRPKTWQVLPDTVLQVEFQHAHELLPNRSWIEMIVNEKVLKHVALTKENAEGHTEIIPIPPSLLKDVNTLRFKVEQHYTDKCEDPLDPSLWTQVLPATKFVFHYNPVLPQVDLKSYPYPLIDPLTYSPAKIHYTVPSGIPAKEAQAMAMVNLQLGQAAHKKEMRTHAGFQRDTSSSSDTHEVILGTPSDNPALSQLGATPGGYKLQGRNWVTPSGQPLEDGAGLILLYSDPNDISRAILVVSGNSSEGVLRAAQYLSTPANQKSLNGSAVMVPGSWNPESQSSEKKPRQIESEDRTFEELELITNAKGYDQVEKVNAPPLTYKFPVVGNFKKPNTQLSLNVKYSYGPDFNPEFSSLEIRMNDRAIGNIPLLNPNGEQDVEATIPISNELILPRNRLVAQFHMLPNKQGYCIDRFIDKAWGRIHKDSRFIVKGNVQPNLPNLTLLGDIGFPFSRHDNLSETHFVIPKDASKEALETLLGFTTRLGRDTKTDTDFRFTLGDSSGDIPKDKDVLIISQKGSDPTSSGVSGLPFLLSWPLEGVKPFLKQFQLEDKTIEKLQDSGVAGYLEQRLSDDKSFKVVTQLAGKREAALTQLAQYFETDEYLDNEENIWEKDPNGSLHQMILLNAGPNVTVADYPIYHEEKPSTTTPSNLKGLPWMFFVGLGILLFIIIIIFPILLRKILPKRR
ncbi:MAG: cellulose biosynthesis cyclic di-GMP-binding regulatory protein BcsB [Cyanobacteria bacterium]|nr:cellulose biosynthesis cyclic di-GMP-binding regulatory protein BcsB [Cyanobacteriota bacterium]